MVPNDDPQDPPLAILLGDEPPNVEDVDPVPTYSENAAAGEVQVVEQPFDYTPDPPPGHSAALPSPPPGYSEDPPGLSAGDQQAQSDGGPMDVDLDPGSPMDVDAASSDPGSPMDVDAASSDAGSAMDVDG